MHWHTSFLIVAGVPDRLPHCTHFVNSHYELFGVRCGFIFVALLRLAHAGGDVWLGGVRNVSPVKG